MAKALIAMSGGVDSSVAAFLTGQMGYECVGCTMRLYENDMIGEDLLGSCCSAKDTGDARAVCERLGIDYHIFHYETEFEQKVIANFADCYECGMTPNPCIECNRHLKFHTLLERADQLGCEKLVTGHYA
ncbi:MAG: tRNA 2-thiouridine(34) synthase MnmA, partial [Lachnospiraceae bacterium]|nr:tRNA 2-thiouridine(34) synthase MnmA [Lachnospiraceae bacterium]